jgi:drug/metabolite transporter (DMT)-like permease
MIWLLLSILLSTMLFVAFKLFSKFSIHVFSAIIFNYLTCFILGNIYLGADHIIHLSVINEVGFLPIICMGMVFIGTFFLMGVSTYKSGAALSSMVSKMSVVIPVIVAMFILKERIDAIKMVGIALSLLSVVLITNKSNEGTKFNWILILVFIGSGLVDTGLNLLKNKHYVFWTDAKMSTLLFFGAFISGLIIILINPKLLKNFDFKSAFGGVLLGTANFFSLIAMFRAIDFYHGKTALFFTMNNVGVVLLSTLVGLAFNEKITAKGYFGLALAIFALILLN